MQFSNKLYKNLAYGILLFLFLVVVIYSFNYQTRVIQNLSFRQKTNLNSNMVEGFGNSDSFKKNNSKFKNEDDIFSLIKNKLRGLTEELGGESGKKEIKKILADTKKICNLECAKCMMNMIEENKGMKTLDFENLLDDENSDNCIKCKKYTELSDSIKSVIDNL